MSPDIPLIITAFLLTIAAIKVVFSKTLIETIIMMSVFSLLITTCYLLMDAPDVAMTEVAISGCLSTCILLKLLKLIPPLEEKRSKVLHITLAFGLCLVFGALLIFAGMDLPSYGSPETSVHTHISKYYIEHTKHDIGIPSFVAAILASYRGYDTLGETLVILIAGLGVLLLSSSTRQNGIN